MRQQMLESTGIWCRVGLRMLHCTRILCKLRATIIGVYLHFLVRSAGLEPPYIKSARDLFGGNSLMGLLVKVFFFLKTIAEILWRISSEISNNTLHCVRKECGKFCGKLAKISDISELLSLMISSKSTGEGSACVMTGV